MTSQMKCAVCGKEFGSDIHCQNCGTDRVTGLGNYSGYNTPISSVMNEEEHVSKPKPESQSIISQHQMTAIGSIVCYACGEVIPDNSKFCPYCSKELYVKCPKCGQLYSSKYPACNQCGTNRVKFEEERKVNSRRGKCTICGYIPDIPLKSLPNDYRCPICKAKSFSVIEEDL